MDSLNEELIKAGGQDDPRKINKDRFELLQNLQRVTSLEHPIVTMSHI